MISPASACRCADESWSRLPASKPPMTMRALGAVVLLSVSLGAQAPAVDTSKIGPQVGATVPAVAGVDQSGTRRTLESVYGPKGAMLVFFRSADW